MVGKLVGVYQLKIENWKLTVPGRHVQGQRPCLSNICGTKIGKIRQTRCCKKEEREKGEEENQGQRPYSIQRRATPYAINPNRSLDHSLNIFACFPSCDGVFCRLFSRHSPLCLREKPPKNARHKTEIKQSLMIWVKEIWISAIRQ